MNALFNSKAFEGQVVSKARKRLGGYCTGVPEDEWFGLYNSAIARLITKSAASKLCLAADLQTLALHALTGKSQRTVIALALQRGQLEATLAMSDETGLIACQLSHALVTTIRQLVGYAAGVLRRVTLEYLKAEARQQRIQMANPNAVLTYGVDSQHKITQRDLRTSWETAARKIVAEVWRQRGPRDASALHHMLDLYFYDHADFNSAFRLVSQMESHKLSRATAHRRRQDVEDLTIARFKSLRESCAAVYRSEISRWKVA